MAFSRNQDLLDRTKAFSLEVIKFVSALPGSPAAQILGRQLLRSATSVGAQYREAHRAKSSPDFISKIQGCLQELDETAYWLELMQGAGLGKLEAVFALVRETEELLSIFVAIAKSVKIKVGGKKS